MTAFPAALLVLPQWILWRGQPVVRGGLERLNKIPIDARTLRKASSTDPQTWNPYGYCVEALPVALEDWQAEDPAGYRGGGLGFVFTPHDPYCGIDLDHVSLEPGTFLPWAAQLVGVFNTYAEISPSQTGVHLLGQATLGQGYKRGPIELYDRARFFTMTGHQVPGTSTTLADIHQPVAWLQTCAEVLAKALARDGDRFSLLFAGQWQHTYPSQSEADLALCRLAVRSGATAEQCDALMRLSGLLRPKWDERHGAQTYGGLTIAKTLKNGTQQQPRTPHTEPAEVHTPEIAPWPTLDETAYYGLAGQIVRTIAPHTESDPVALLGQILVMFGNAIGRAPYFPVEADQHFPNEFLVLVGKSSRGRKGTSAGYARRLLSLADPAWGSRVMGGMSSGEGIIWHVRDPLYGLDKQGEEVLKDAGSEDKRLCILETEFARALAKMTQDGNILSAILRQAFDEGTLRSLVSGRTHAPVTATHAHVSMIAHVTVEELQRLLTETEAANGFGNRVLWLCVKRARLLPRGGGYPTQALALLLEQLKEALFAARRVGTMHRSSEAEILWERLYPVLTEERAGLLGAITSRAEVHTLRLACLYALLDKTDTITPGHLDAAYALWRYGDDSARYLFGALLGDPIADEILRMLKAAGSAGMTRTDLYNAFGRNVPSARIGHALSTLQRDQLIVCRHDATAGRPVERWQAR